jgi:nucleotide-binding universal stress UspA family protein
MEIEPRTEPRPIGIVSSESTTTILEEPKPIVWALDAFPDQADLQLELATTLETLFPQSRIFPVYVLSEESFNDRGMTNFLRPALKPMARKAMASLISAVNAANIQAPRVLIERSSSQAACARRLIRFAKRVGAALIAGASHGRKGLDRFLAGSFSEAVLEQSRVPVLLTGPKLEHTHARPTVIVYPTDFSPACAEGYKHVLRLASFFDADLHLFHKTVHNVDPLIQSGVSLLGGGWVSLESYLDPTTDLHRPDAEDWVKRAADLGVKAHYMSEAFREPTWEAIVEYVRKLEARSTLIAMVPQVGPVTSAILGSITREVIRQSPCPVYLTPHVQT